MECMEIKSGAKQNCRIRVAVGVRARAPRGKILGERQGGFRRAAPGFVLVAGQH